MKVAKKRLFCLLACLGSSYQVCANEPDKKAIVEVEALQKPGSTDLLFKVKPAGGMQLTFEAPWSLNIESLEGAKSEKDKFSKTDLDQNLPGFSVKTTPLNGNASGKVNYKIVTFACTEDKKQCFRESHQQSFTFRQEQTPQEEPK